MTMTLPNTAPRANEPAERVKALRRRVQAGDYRVDAPVVAESLLRTLLCVESSRQASGTVRVTG